MSSEDNARDVSVLGLVFLWLAFTVVSIGLWRLVPTVFGWEVVPYSDLAASAESLFQNVTVAEGIVDAVPRSLQAWDLQACVS
jgi:hypothetical protein